MFQQGLIKGGTLKEKQISYVHVENIYQGECRGQVPQGKVGTCSLFFGLAIAGSSPNFFTKGLINNGFELKTSIVAVIRCTSILLFLRNSGLLSNSSCWLLLCYHFRIDIAILDILHRFEPGFLNEGGKQMCSIRRCIGFPSLSLFIVNPWRVQNHRCLRQDSSTTRPHFKVGNGHIGKDLAGTSGKPYSTAPIINRFPFFSRDLHLLMQALMQVRGDLNPLMQTLMQVQPALP
jgi:hypothetical protein